MGKKKPFIEKNSGRRYKLIPAFEVPKQGKFVPTQEHLDEQNKFGVFYDDDYDYMQHLRDVRQGFKLQALDEEEETFVVKAPSRPPIPSFMFEDKAPKPTKDTYDEDIAHALESDFDGCENGDLEDDFVLMAGGAAAKEQLIRHREVGGDETDQSEDDSDDYSDEDDYLSDEDGSRIEGVNLTASREGPAREIDTAFDKLLEADYNEYQVGELEGDQDELLGMLEPDDGRLKRLTEEKRNDPQYDEQAAKDYVRQRMALLKKGAIQEDEEEDIEVDESCRKRMKWDCESFATQYSNIYNHPTLIKDARGKLSRRALKRLDRETMDADMADVEEEADEDMSDDASVCTVSTFRPKGETPEQRKLRKNAVKEARRARREEKKCNKEAFATEHRKVAKARVGVIRSTPIV